MFSSFRRRPLALPFAALSLTLATVAMTGCSFDRTQPALPSASAEVAGIIHGGPNPVGGATVKLYATQTNGYGGAGKLLATTSTNSAGSFSFTPSSYTCPAGQQAYITSAAGNTGANTSNNNSLLMAAIGPCSNLTASTQIWIDELSTIAAAYALGNFTTISGSGASAVVNVSAPANNNASAGACTGAGVTLSCVAAGLPHAFLNAANLVNSVGTTTAPPSGQAYATPPSNPTTSSTAVALQNVVPQQLINTLGNIVQACVNSSGGAIAGDGSACGTLFANTTSTSTYTATPVTPTNTLQALINLAKFPFTGSTNLYNIAQSSGFYQPSLTAAPPDFSIAIIFRSYGSGANQIGTTYYTSADINDNVYATALTAPSTGSILGALPYVAHSLSSTGAGNWTTPATILSAASFATYTCDSWGGTAATAGACQAAPDTAGNLWVGMGSTNFVGGGLWQVKQASGSVSQFTTASGGTTFYPIGIAVDANNDVFYSTANTSGAANFWKLPSGSTASTVPSPLTAGGSNVLAGHTSGSIVFDTAGNLFAPENSGGNVGFTFAANTGTLSAEAFGTADNNCNCLGGSIDNWPAGGMVDSSGNYWMTGAASIVKVAGPADAQLVTGGGSTGVNAFTIGNSATTLRVSSMDGAGTIFVPDNATGGTVNPQSAPPPATAPALRLFYTPLSSNASIQGCNVGTATGNTTCITGAQTAPNSGLFYQAVNPAIDSTGSLWISSEGNDAVIQVIGLAAPTWPQASYLHPGVMPQ